MRVLVLLGLVPGRHAAGAPLPRDAPTPPPPQMPVPASASLSERAARSRKQHLTPEEKVAQGAIEGLLTKLQAMQDRINKPGSHVALLQFIESITKEAQAMISTWSANITRRSWTDPGFFQQRYSNKAKGFLATHGSDILDKFAVFKEKGDTDTAPMYTAMLNDLQRGEWSSLDTILKYYATDLELALVDNGATGRDRFAQWMNLTGEGEQYASQLGDEWLCEQNLTNCTGKFVANVQKTNMTALAEGGPLAATASRMSSLADALDDSLDDLGEDTSTVQLREDLDAAHEFRQHGTISRDVAELSSLGRDTPDPSDLPARYRAAPRYMLYENAFVPVCNGPANCESLTTQAQCEGTEVTNERGTKEHCTWDRSAVQVTERLRDPRRRAVWTSAVAIDRFPPAEVRALVAGVRAEQENQTGKDGLEMKVLPNARSVIRSQVTRAAKLRFGPFGDVTKLLRNRTGTQWAAVLLNMSGRDWARAERAAALLSSIKELHRLEAVALDHRGRLEAAASGNLSEAEEESVALRKRLLNATQTRLASGRVLEEVRQFIPQERVAIRAAAIRRNDLLRRATSEQKTQAAKALVDFLAAVTEATELAGKDLKANVSAVHSEVVRDLEEDVTNVTRFARGAQADWRPLRTAARDRVRQQELALQAAEAEVHAATDRATYVGVTLPARLKAEVQAKNRDVLRHIAEATALQEQAARMRTNKFLRWSGGLAEKREEETDDALLKENETAEDAILDVLEGDWEQVNYMHDTERADLDDKLKELNHTAGEAGPPAELAREKEADAAELINEKNATRDAATTAVHDVADYQHYVRGALNEGWTEAEERSNRKVGLREMAYASKFEQGLEQLLDVPEPSGREKIAMEIIKLLEADMAELDKQFRSNLTAVLGARNLTTAPTQSEAVQEFRTVLNPNFAKLPEHLANMSVDARAVDASIAGARAAVVQALVAALRPADDALAREVNSTRSTFNSTILNATRLAWSLGLDLPAMETAALGPLVIGKSSAHVLDSYAAALLAMTRGVVREPPYATVDNGTAALVNASADLDEASRAASTLAQVFLSDGIGVQAGLQGLAANASAGSQEELGNFTARVDGLRDALASFGSSSSDVFERFNDSAAAVDSIAEGGMDEVKSLAEVARLLRVKVAGLRGHARDVFGEAVAGVQLLPGPAGVVPAGAGGAAAELSGQAASLKASLAADGAEHAGAVAAAAGRLVLRGKMVAPTIKAQEELLLTDLDQPIRMADYQVEAVGAAAENATRYAAATAARAAATHGAFAAGVLAQLNESSAENGMVAASLIHGVKGISKDLLSQQNDIVNRALMMAKRMLAAVHQKKDSVANLRRGIDEAMASNAHGTLDQIRKADLLGERVAEENNETEAWMESFETDESGWRAAFDAALATATLHAAQNGSIYHGVGNYTADLDGWLGDWLRSRINLTLPQLVAQNVSNTDVVNIAQSAGIREDQYLARMDELRARHTAAMAKHAAAKEKKAGVESDLNDFDAARRASEKKWVEEDAAEARRLHMERESGNTSTRAVLVRPLLNRAHDLLTEQGDLNARYQTSSARVLALYGQLEAALSRETLGSATTR